jgi:S1-C subfamily serine protease
LVPLESPSPEASYQDPFDPPANLSALVDQVALATYIIDCGDGYGSGWGLTLQWRGATRSFIVTNHHVVDECIDGKPKLKIIDRELNEFTGEGVAAKDREPDFERDLVRQDLALIEPDSDDFSTLDRLVSGGYPIGSWVMTSSNPGLEDNYYTPAITYGNIAADSVLDGYVITAAVNPGSSGGVVVNSRGEVLGTIWGGNDQSELNDAGYFLPLSNLWSLMGELPLEKSR